MLYKELGIPILGMGTGSFSSQLSPGVEAALKERLLLIEGNLVATFLSREQSCEAQSGCRDDRAHALLLL